MLKKTNLKKYFSIYRPFLQFLTIFFGVYLFTTFLYQSYLNSYAIENHEVDGFTTFVAHQSNYIVVLFDKNAHVMASKTEASVLLFYKNKNVAKVVEGCNAISIAILFISFIVAFAGKFKPTLFFSLFGIFIIHIINILRIGLLSVLFFEIPEYKSVLHGVVFPFIIYSIVFILWIIWTNKFSKYATKSSK